MRHGLSLCLLALLLPPAGILRASDLYKPSNWSSLASDQRASEVGAIVTIVVYENASATNSASSGSKKEMKLGGTVSASPLKSDKDAALTVGGNSSSNGSTGRSGQMVAQISASVDEVMPNGDLRISGSQLINVNGEKTTIKVKGRIRPADIAAGNVILSTRLADAMIDYNGSGFVSRSGKPGIVSRIFNWLGLL